MRRLEHLDLAKRELAQHGIVPHVTTTNGNHLRLTWCVNGKPQFVLVSNTPSKNYAADMIRADVRRLLRKAGLAGG
jgi:hypothetical protein